MSIKNNNLVQTGLFGSNSQQSGDSIVNDRRTAPVLSNISTCVAVSVTEPQPFFPIVGFEKNSYEVFLSMPRDDGSVKLISLVVPSLEIANKIQFRHLYQLVNPRGKNKYKSYDVIEVWAEDVKEVSLK